MAELSVVRLLQNPLGQQAPEGERGDLVLVSDGQSKVYLMPWELKADDESWAVTPRGRGHRGAMTSSAMCSPSIVKRWSSSTTPPGKSPSRRWVTTQRASSTRCAPMSSVV